VTPEQITQLLDELGQRLGPAGEHVFQLAVRQAFIDGWTMIGLFIVVGLLSLVCGLLAIFHEWDSYSAAPISLGFGAVFGGAISMLALSYGIPYLLNPEYQAIKSLLEALP